MMKKLCALIVFTGLVVGLYAQSADITYIDGWVDVKSKGALTEAQEGDVLHSGDSVITRDDSFAELEQQNLSTITVQPNSIFMIQEKQGSGGRETVLSTTVGEVSFKFGKLLGKEPAIATPSMVAGIRGTEFTVYAGEDGSSLVAVTSGLVTVSAEGKSVDLHQDEGVEVKSGEAPGEKFKLKGRELDFSTWNKKKYDALMADPVTGLRQLGKQLDGFIADIQEYDTVLKKMKADKVKLKASWQSMLDKGEKDKAREFYNKNIMPIDQKLGPVFLNIRYYSLSALSFRRFILGKVYVDMKARYIIDRKNEQYRKFIDNYRLLIGKFEKDVVPFLDRNDF